MAFTLKVDFDNLYDIEPISEDIRSVVFNTELINDQELPLHVVISHESHDLLPNVYNLAFGPIGANGKIDDKIEITHKDYSKVFSTILFVAFTYLTNNPEHYLGIDGSNNGRAYFYYRAQCFI